MSYILDALRKSEAQRSKETPPSTENFTLKEMDTPVFGGWFKPAVAITIVLALVTLVTVVAKVSFRSPLPSLHVAAPQAPSPVAQQSGPRAPTLQPSAPPHALAMQPPRASLTRMDTIVSPTPRPIPAAPHPTPLPRPTQENAPAPSVAEPPTPVTTKPVRHAASGPNMTAQDAFKQGWKNINEGLFNQAYDDFSQAITLEPGFAKAWFARAWAEEKRGHRKGAISDYSQVLRLTPEDAQAFLSRGVLRFYNDDFVRAAQDFKSAARFARPELERYALLWLYIADHQGDVKRDAYLQEHLQTVDLTPWPGIILRHFNAEASRGDIERSIAQSRNVKERRQRVCVAYYFLGQKALIDGDSIQAKADFNRAVQTGVAGYRQYEAARFALNRLSVTPGKTRP